MSLSTPFDPKLSELPDRLPVFPLSGVLLLPRGHLPLNIFEPRYLAMTRAALGQPQRLVGMIQPRAADDPDSDTLFQTGCAGRITSFAETDDGRFLITLTGVSRFNLARELGVTAGGYREVAPDFGPFESDLRATEQRDLIDRDKLKAVLECYFDKNKIKACWDTISDTDDETLVTSLAMACAFPSSEKQALLESRNLYDRCETLIALLQMAVHSGAATVQPS